MATDWQSLSLDQAELLSTRLKDLISHGQDYIRSQFGIEIGLTPELYPTWAILSTAVVGLLVVLVLSWAVLCGGLGGKKRGSFVNPANNEHLKTPPTKAVKPEEFKIKKNKKKSEKKAEHNGRPVPVPQEEVKVVQESSTPLSEVKHDTVQAPSQAKNKKKKAKPELKSSKNISASTNGKEPEDAAIPSGAWETKVSHREKKQQRKKDKGPDGSGSPGGAEASVSHAEPPAAPAPVNSKKNREPLHLRTNGKGNAVPKTASSGRREEHHVNGSGKWAEVPPKQPGQTSALEGDKWPAMPTGPRPRAQAESRGQETHGKLRGMDPRIKTELNPMSFSHQGSNTAEPLSGPTDPHCDSRGPVEDDWSGVRLAAADPASDWNAPSVPWVNSEEPAVGAATVPVPVPIPPPKEQPAPRTGKPSDEENEDPAGEGDAKTKKKKKKKKKKPEEEGAPAQTSVGLPAVQPRGERAPPANPPVSQRKSEPTAEPPKPAQKKKSRRET